MPSSTSRLRPVQPLALLVATALAALTACGGGGGDGGGPTEPPPQNNTVATLQASSATSQTATVGTAVGEPPAVVARNSAGQPVAGVSVTFAATGGGTVGAASVKTNASGVASAGSWLLGTTAGANTLTATAGSRTAQFTATGTPGPVDTLAVMSGSGQQGTTGQALPNPIVFKATDAHGNAVSNVAITFAAATGGGSIAPASATTGASGEAQTTWTLGGTAGAQTLTAVHGALTTTVTAQAAVLILKASQVDAGAGANCARSAEGQLACWGANGAGVIGDGTTTFREFPVQPSVSGVTFAHVSVGTSNSCALTSTGAAYCWGSGYTNGDGSFSTPRLSPVAVSGGHAFTKLVVGATAACALKADGTAWCWGTTLPPESNLARKVPTLVSSTLRFTDVAVGSWPSSTLADYPCGITTTGSTYCWGIMGIGDAADPSEAPAELGGGVTFSSLALGRDHACGLTEAGKAYCWGQNDRGQLGDGTSGNTRATPVAVVGGTSFVALASGGAHTCGLTAAGAALCWGANDGGQLGNAKIGDGTSVLGPTPVPTVVAMPTGVQFTSITAGNLNTCAIASNSEVWCWGTRASSHPAIVFADKVPRQVRQR
ncbi:MAG: hypothetical protein ACYC2G_01285 [Gemmatimonadaceae bacterium]